MRTPLTVLAALAIVPVAVACGQSKAARNRAGTYYVVGYAESWTDSLELDVPAPLRELTLVLGADGAISVRMPGAVGMDVKDDPSVIFGGGTEASRQGLTWRQDTLVTRTPQGPIVYWVRKPTATRKLSGRP